MEFPGRLSVLLEGTHLCAIAPLPSQAAIALEWSPEATGGGDDAGANLVRRQAPLLAGVHRVGRPECDGLPGFLADSLPDA